MRNKQEMGGMEMPQESIEQLEGELKQEAGDEELMKEFQKEEEKSLSAKDTGKEKSKQPFFKKTLMAITATGLIALGGAEAGFAKEKNEPATEEGQIEMQIQELDKKKNILERKRQQIKQEQKDVIDRLTITRSGDQYIINLINEKGEGVVGIFDVPVGCEISDPQGDDNPASTDVLVQYRNKMSSAKLYLDDNNTIMIREYIGGKGGELGNFLATYGLEEKKSEQKSQDSKLKVGATLEGKTIRASVTEIKENGIIILQSGVRMIELRPTSEDDIYEYNQEGTELPDGAVALDVSKGRLNVLYEYGHIDKKIERFSKFLDKESQDLIKKTPFEKRDFNFYKKVNEEINSIDATSFNFDEWKESSRATFDYDLNISEEAQKVLSKWGGKIEDNVFFWGDQTSCMNNATERIDIEKANDNTLICTIKDKDGSITTLTCIEGRVVSQALSSSSKENKKEGINFEYSEKNAMGIISKWGGGIGGNIIYFGKEKIEIDPVATKKVDLVGVGDSTVIITIEKKDGIKEVITCVDGQIKNRTEIK